MPSAADSLPLPSTFRPMITVGTLGGRSPAKVDPRVAAHGGRHLKLLPTAPWSRRRASTNTIAEAGRAPAQLTFTTDSNLGVSIRALIEPAIRGVMEPVQRCRFRDLEQVAF